MKKLLIIFSLLLMWAVQGYSQSVTPVYYPRFIEGVGNGNVADLRSVPYACRMSLTGLIPNRLYYYYNRFVLDTTNANPAPNGQGTVIIAKRTGSFQRITGPNLADSTFSGAFTTDASGSYTGWFITEPSSASVFFPGGQVYWRIMLRNEQFAPASAVELRLTAPQSVTVLQWSGYAPPPGTPPAGFVGTLLTRATNTEYTAKNFVMLFDNVAGTGRPLSGTFVEDDGIATTGLGYIAPYNALGATNTRWGAIIPSGAPAGPGLANGVRNISQYSLLSADLINVCNGNGAGVFGAINTVNPAGTTGPGAGVLNITTCGPPVVACLNLNASTVATGTACNANTGSVNLTVSGGTAPYTYAWTGPGGFTAATEDISGLAGGSYSVTVTDNTGVCTANASAFITSTQLITLSSSVINESACASNNGSIDLTVGGGVGPYTYAWTGPGGFTASTEDITGLGVGTYNVVVNGAGTCTASATMVVTKAPALVASASFTPIPNCGGPTTTITVNGSGGTAPYTGTGNFVVSPGTHTYTVTDARGCTASTTVTVAAPTCINAVEVLYPKYIQGVGSGSPSSDLKVPFVNRMTLTGLTPNATYRYFHSFIQNPASGANGAAGAILLPDPSGFIRITSTSVNNAGEYGEFTANGSGSYTGWFILEPASDIIFSPGNSLYWRINLNDGAGGTTVATRVTAANPVTVINWGTTSGASLEGSAIYNAANPAWVEKNIVMLYDNIGGTGRPVTGTFIEDDGVAETTAENYDLFYELLVNGFPNVWGTIIPNDLANGINNISQYALSDGSFVNKCTSPDGVYGATDTKNASKGNADPFTPDLLLIECTPTAGCSLAGTTAVTNVACFGASTGAVNLTVTGASSPSFAWTGPGGFTATTEDISGLIAGTYSVTITDGSCTLTETAIVGQPAAALSTGSSITHVLCFGASTGAIDLSVSGGTAPYTYAWTGPGGFTAASQDISGLAAGTYNVTVTDNSGCVATASAVVNQPASLSTNTSITHVACFGGNTGAVDLSVSGGSSPYSYSWSGPGGFNAASQDISGLVAGTYNVTVTDNNGCVATASAVVNQPAAALSASTSVTHATCGASNGSIDLSVSGGTAPYGYAWTGPGGFAASTQDISGLAAGTYNVTVTDNNGCIVTASAVVNNIGAPSVTLSSVTPVSCFGGSNGAIDINVSGGTVPYSYVWTGPGGFSASSQDISGLVAGTYNVTVTDNNGCVATANAVVNQPSAALSTNSSVTHVSCFGGSNGAVDLSVSGGTSPYSYAWTGPGGFSATSQDISGLVAGTYNVTVTDNNGCVSSASAVVNQPAAALSTSSSITHVLCFGASTGAIDLSVSGGTSPYSYAWSGPGGFSATSQDISGLVAGTYNVTVTDNNGCEATASAVVNQPAAALSASTSVTHATCGSSNGAVDLSVAGGTAPYSYAWSGPGGFSATSQDISGLAAGTYNVTISDANECIITASAIVNNVGAPSVTVSNVTHVLCFGGSTGAIDISVSGGTVPYSYVWSGPGGFSAASQDISGLVAGTYNVTVTDNNGCVASASAVVNQPSAALSAGISVTHVSCFGGNNGAVDLTVSGGTSPYSYAWSGPGGFSSTSQDISGLVAGTYNVTVTDNNGCVATASAVVNQPSSALSASTSVVHVLCFGGSTGSIDMSVSGGTSPYSYAWSGPGGFSATSQDISGLVAGTYNVTVTDANGCVATASAVVNQPAAALSTSSSITHVLCFGQSTGAIDLSVSGGTAPYSYAWSGPGGFSATSQDISGLAAGTYNVTVTDANSCTVTASVVVNQPAAALSTSTSVTHVLCFGASTGVIDLTVNGGTSPYSYAWSGPGGFSATSQDISGLVAGTYNVTVTDANSCTITASAVVNQPSAALSASSSVTHVLCFGGSTGAVDLSVSGGSSPYSYTWSGPGGFSATSQDISGLIAGTYNVTVTDNNGCFVTANAVVNQPAAALSANTSVTHATCGASNGAIDLSVSGGTSPYSYSWSGPGGFVATSQDISGLVAGTYNVTVTDNNGCIATASAVVNNLGAPVVTVSSVTHVLCFGGSTGAIDISVSGGTSPYTYVWTGPGGFSAATQDISGLVAGTYNVTVTDNNGCVTSASAVVNQPSVALSASTSVVHVLCFGGSSGSVDLSVSGGSSLYSYAWSGPGGFSATSQDISGLVAGTYNVTVTDANGCVATASAVVNQPSVALSASTSVTHATCGSSNGAIDLTVNGGTAPYSYAWSGPGGFSATSQDISGLAAGVYNVTVTDNNGCVATASATVNNVGAPSVVVSSVTHVSCFGGSNGAIDISVSGGSSPYSYAWSGPGGFSSTSQDISGLVAGTYNVTVTDNNGCVATASAVVNQPSAALTASAVGAGLTCNTTGNNGTINLTVAGGTAPYSYAWSGPGGFSATTEDLSGLAAGVYNVVVTDANGCSASASATILARLAATAVASPTACADVTGTITVTATGGVAPYIFRRVVPGSDSVTITGASPAVFTNVPFGTYVIRVVDAAGCIRTINNVRIAGPLVASGTVAPVACGATSTTITVTASQGVAPYSGLGTFPVTIGVPYSFTVSDARGCSVVVSGVVNAPFCPTVSEVLYPKYVQGVGSGSPSADTKVPYAARMTISGLTPGATYRYFSRFVTNPSSTLSNGIGDLILVNQAGNFSRVVSASMSTAGEYGEFTADGSGNYTGWFVQEPSSDIGFTPGNQLYWRIMLNDGAGGTVVSGRGTASNSVTVLGFGSSPSEGTGLRRTTSADYTAKNFVMLYNNVGGTGRPEAGTFIESDGTVNGAAEGYAPFYETSVDGADKTWGTIIPNNLSNGINNISQYALASGSFVNACTSPNGVFGGTTDTKNASGGLNELVISACEAPCNVSLTFTQVNVSCFGGNDGSIDLSVSGGTSPYTYVWTGPGGFSAATQDISGLVAGTYNVTVTDNNGCVTSASAVVNQPSVALSASTSVVHVLCFGGSSGSVDLSVSGGSSPYSYAWSGPGGFSATSQDISGLVAGTYNVTVTDANGCVATASAVVNQPSVALSASTSVTHATCGSSNGAIDLTVNGGTAPYSYAWSGPGGFSATSQDISGLAAGVYNVTVTDNNGCVATASATVNNVGAPSVVVSSVTHVSCFGGSNGAIDISVSGGSSPYSYAWSGPGGFSSTSQDISGLVAGTYNVTVTDNNGCVATASAVVNQPSAALTASAVGAGLTCNTTGNNGTINLTVAGGTAPYSYAWSGPGGFSATTEDLSGLAAGVYNVVVTDANGCSASASATILARLAATAVASPTACADVTGTITVTATGGVAPYIFRRVVPGSDSVTITGASPAVFTNVPFGTYVIRVVDAAGCIRTINNVRIAGPLVASGTVAPVACGATSTTITVTASQGVAPYSGLGTFPVTIGVPYSFTVSDARGCSVVVSGVVNAPFCPTVSEVLYPKYVQGVGSGSPSADTKVPYAARMTISGLTPGATYRYFSRFVTNPSSTLSNGIGDLILVNQAGNFSRVVSASMSTAGEYGEFTADGSGNYTGWFVQEPSSDIGFTPGNQLYWRIMLNDGAGGTVVSGRGTASNSVTVLGFGSSPSEGTGLRRTTSADYTAKNFVMLYNNVGGTGRPEAGTFIESDGTVNGAAEGYAPFYETSVDGADKTWGTIIPNNLSNGINNISQYALASGSFVNACTSPNGVFGGTTDTKNASGGLNELVISACEAPCNLTLSAVATNVVCFEGENGAIDLTVAGAQGAVTYAWSGPGGFSSTSEDLSGLFAGIYTVVVTETGNPSCTATLTVNITEPGVINPPVVGAITHPTCAIATGSVVLSGLPSGNWTIMRNPGAVLTNGSGASTTISGLAPGTYTFIVTNAAGCASGVSANVIINAQPAAPAAPTVNVVHPSCTVATGTITITSSTAGLLFSLDGGAFAAYPGGGYVVAAGAHTLRAQDANGCISAVTNITVNAQPASPAAPTVSVVHPSCTVATGTITITSSTAGLLFSLDGGAFAAYPGGGYVVAAGAHTLSAQNAAGCNSAVTNITVNAQPASPAAPTVNVVHPSCIVATGTITITSSTAGLLFSLDGGAFAAYPAGGYVVAAGAHTLSAQNAAGCNSGVTNITVNAQPASPAAPTVSVVHPSCTVATGTIAITSSTAGLLFSLDGGAFAAYPAGGYVVAAGSHNLRAQNAAGCISATTTITVNAQPASPAAPTVGVITHPTCTVATGSVVLSGLPSGNWTITRSPGGVTTNGSGASTTISGLAAGSYTFTVTNAAGCTSGISANVVINEQPATAAAPTVGAITHPSACAATGSVVLNGLPSGNWTITRNPGGVTTTGSGASTTINGLAAGTYTFTVTNAAGCTSAASANVVINAQPAALTVSTTSTPANAGNNGTATANASGGTAPYTYLWNPGGQTTQTATGLAAGTYTVVVTDARGCTVTGTAIVGSGGCSITVNAGPDRSLCSGPVTLTANVSGAILSGPPPPQPFTEVSGSTADMRIFSGNIDRIVIGNTFSQSEDRNNCGQIVETSKALTLPAGAIVKKAYLYWSGSRSGSQPDDQVKINTNAMAASSYTNITAESVKTYSRSGGFNYFGCRADITSYVNSSGTIKVKDLSWNNGAPYCFDNSAYGGWAMVVVYEQSSLPSSRIHVNSEKFQFTYPAATYSTSIPNISVPAGCNANAQLTFVAFEGDNYKGENLRINGVLDADPNNFRGQSGPNLDIITKNAPSVAPGTTSLTYSIESYLSGSPFGPAIEGLFDYVKVLKYNNCPPACNSVTYLWKKDGSAVGTTASIVASQAGQYTVQVTDCAGCIARDTVNVSTCPPVDPNKCYKLIARHSGKALGIENSSTANGADAEQRTYNGGNNQVWKFADAGSGYYNITNYNSNKSLEVTSGSGSNGAIIQQNAYTGVDYQKWSLTASGSYYIVSPKHSGKSMTVKDASTSNGADIEQRSGTANHQQWTIAEIGCPIMTTIVKIDNKEEPEEELEAELIVSAHPNPSTDYFTLVIKSNDAVTPVSVRIMDLNGNLLATHNPGAGRTLKVGERKWASGTYMAEIIQGKQRKIVRLIKAN